MTLPFLMYLTRIVQMLEVSIPLESLFKELHFGTKINYSIFIVKPPETRLFSPPLSFAKSTMN